MTESNKSDLALVEARLAAIEKQLSEVAEAAKRLEGTARGERTGRQLLSLLGFGGMVAGMGVTVANPDWSLLGLIIFVVGFILSMVGR